MSSDRVGYAGGVGYHLVLAGLVLLAPGVAQDVDAGGPFRRARAARETPVPATRVEPAPGVGAVNNYGRLGTFYPTPFIEVRGNIPAGGGYSPLWTFGDTTLSLYGPLSAFRMTSAPVVTYTRGYDGRTTLAPGTSFSAPNLPALTPVVNPTQASYYYGFRKSGSPPWWANGINWIDQN